MTMLMHSHHEGPLFEPTINPQERYDYILSNKLKEELPIRLALFAAIPDEVVRLYLPSSKAGVAYEEARDACDKAGVAYAKAWRAYEEAGVAYEEARDAEDKAWVARDKAWVAYAKAGVACDYERMHRDLCWPWCPGEHIFANGYDLAALARLREEK